jgi:uncharacterized protein (DUF952 family)
MRMVDEPTMVYKICTQNEWQQLQIAKQFSGSPDDLRDGFVHLSAATQVARTAAKFFAGRADLFLLALNADQLGNGLKWETSASGATYPHLYAPLPLQAVASCIPLPLGADGRHILPLEFASC